MKFGIPISQWLRYPKINTVVFTSVSTETLKTDQPDADIFAASSQNYLHQFWLKAANPLVYTLKKAEKLEIPLKQWDYANIAEINRKCNSIAHQSALILPFCIRKNWNLG